MTPRNTPSLPQLLPHCLVRDTMNIEAGVNIDILRCFVSHAVLSSTGGELPHLLDTG